MTDEKLLNPDYLFEISWEVCNKVGGIYTVLSTKAPLIAEKLKDNYLLIGPDVWKETLVNPEFIEDNYAYRLWRDSAEKQGLKFRMGRWNITGKPLVILVDFTQLFVQKDTIFSELWEKYHLDSYYGQWDYVEPALFGIAAARIIRSFYEFHISSHDRIVAQFHEWMTGTGVLYLNDKAPQIGTVFTTHATVLGRSIAGNNLPLYSKMSEYESETTAKNMGVVSKFSLEKTSAQHADCFTTVSQITATECAHFLGKNVDVITPNGFDGSLVPEKSIYDEKRKNTRLKLKTVAEGLLNQPLPDNTVFLLNSGRYEFYNKGIDLFINALGKLNKDENLNQNIVACIAVPAYHAGPSQNLLNRAQERNFSDPVINDYCTHYLHHYKSDAMIKCITSNNLQNSPSDKVKIMIVPCYLDGKDGVFNLSYYDFLIGFDLTVFPSYYEPWGYTPLESIAFHIPTITTTYAGFGMWALSKQAEPHDYISVIKRDDENQEYVTSEIYKRILAFTKHSYDERIILRSKAYEISQMAFWEHMVLYYFQAFDVALKKSEERFELYHTKTAQADITIQPKTIQPPVWKKILIKPIVPENLQALHDLTLNLWWTWNFDAIDLFSIIKPKIWKKCNYNPIALIGSLSLDDYINLEKNTVFLKKLQAVSCRFNEYMAKTAEKPKELIAYFSMEFGLHDSIKTYSGGLGILAGDYLKEASDSNANIIGVSLLYRYGYFDQNISLLGDQIESYHPQKYSLLPLIPVRNELPDDNGNDNNKIKDNNNGWMKVRIAAPGRTIYAKVWRVEVGRVTLYLLDTDIDDNLPEDRMISHRLYGGDNEIRFKQELLLGVGGIRVLDQLGIKPDIFHCNEGHAAFMGIERLQKYVQEENLTFKEALEVVRASTLFTTHTPVPAGHDTFSEDLVRTYISHYAERLKISWEKFINLGKKSENDVHEDFNMSILASRLSSEINGVSKIHRRVTRKMFAPMYPGYFPKELNIGYVTNGVHFPTWVSKKWKHLYDEIFDKEYIDNQSKAEYWKKIYEVPDETIWGLRQQHRSELIGFIRNRLLNEMTLRQDNPKNIFKVQESLSEKALTIGFARRFATYKRAQLLFNDTDRLAKIVNDPKRPVQFIYAGKAHPHDEAGQELIKQIYDISQRPEFVGKIVFIENYDINLGKKLTQGVDIWLDTPTHPEEASGTSGQKAVMNGVMNFSVLDGWWAEGYLPNAGWAIKEELTYANPQAQNAIDAVTIYNMLENEIIPLFYERNDYNIPVKWIQHIKNTIARIAPQFTMKRMMDDYYEKFYNKICQRSSLMNADNYMQARKLASWKQKMIRGWDSIEVLSMKTIDTNKKPLGLGELFHAEIQLRLNELKGNDIGIDVLLAKKVNDVVENIIYCEEMQITQTQNNIVTYYFEMPVEIVGVYDYIFRIFPKNPLLAHRQDFNLMKWI